MIPILKTRPRPRQSGYGLVEVLVAALIMAVGFVALAKMQTGLIGSATDARDRTVATKLANERLEAMRGFSSGAQYRAIDSSATPETLASLGGTSFQRSWTVARYRYEPDPNADGNPADAGFVLMADNTADVSGQPEFKQVTVTVGWTNAAGEAKQVALADIISSADPRDGLSTAREDADSQVTPAVRIYKPDEEGVIPIAIGQTDAGDDLAAAASNPKPKQYAEGSTGTTRFTVQNFVNDQTNPLLQSSIDFAYASCVCKQAGLSTTTNPAYEPTYWDGLRYVPPKAVVGKPTGVRHSGVDQNAPLCDTCCRDHHDATASQVRYDPFRTDARLGNGDHAHYDPAVGFASPVTATGGVYAESCRLVRVDGIYRVATDTRLEDLAMLRLDRATSPPSLADATVDAYANYARDFVAEAFAAKDAGYPGAGLPSPRADLAPDYELAAASPYGSLFMDEDRDAPVTLALSPSPGKASLAARGLYIDWLSPKALERIACIGQSTTQCLPYSGMSLLQMVPFVAVNLTDLSNWSSTAPTKASVRNDPIPLSGKGKGNNNTTNFVRGEVTAVSDGQAVTTTTITRSNSGVVDTRAIDPQDLAFSLSDQEEFVIGTAPTSPDAPGQLIVQIGDGTGDRNFADLDIKVEVMVPAVGAPVCIRGDRNSGADRHQCVYDPDATSLVLRLSNYNYPTCAPLGNKWTYDSVNERCVLPPKNKNFEPEYADAIIRDFALCSVSSPVGPIKAGGLVVANAGTAAEYTEASFSLVGMLDLGAALAGNTLPFNASFKVSCP